MKRKSVNIIVKLFLISTIVFMTMLFVLFGMVIGIVINYSKDLPELEPMDYSQTATWKQHLEIYSSISKIEEGTTKEFLMDKLDHLGYEEAELDIPAEKGQYSLKLSDKGTFMDMVIYLRDFHYPRKDRDSYIVKINFRRDKISRMQRDGKRVYSFELEPELISELYGKEGTTREIIRLNQVSDDLLKSFIAIEDVRFYQHWGVDPRRILGALLRNIRTRRFTTGAHGASTITQQLTRGLFLSRRQKYSRKIKEALLAVKIEHDYSKDEILEYHLNFIDLGRYGSRELHGVQRAAEGFFGKPAWKLELHECATLAAIPKSPTLYSPIRHPDNAKRRRNDVLSAMLKHNFITDTQYSESIEKPLEVNPPKAKKRGEAPHFLEYVQRNLEKEYEPSFLYNRGLKVYTTIDMTMQRVANQAMLEHLKRLDGKINTINEEKNNVIPDDGIRPLQDSDEFEEKIIYPDYDENKKDPKVDPLSYLQGALISIEPQTGKIKAMLGGREYYVTPRVINFFNRAVDTKRQPGSSFKPFVLTAAFSGNSPISTPAVIVEDEPWFTIDYKGDRWAPRNYKNRYYGKVTVRTMIEKSINVATARFMNEDVGIEKTIQTARSLGIKSELKPYPSLALGSSDVTPMEMTSAYGVLADDGMYAEPLAILFVEDRQGKIIEEHKPTRYRVIEEKVAYLVTYILQGVLTRGTGVRTRGMGFTRPAAGKTGTTNDYTDAWFIGFVPDLVTSVWVGFNDPQKSTEHEGAHAALPIWTDFMKEAVQGTVEGFTAPEGIVFRDIDKETGLPPTASTPEDNIINEAFISGTEPR